MKNLVIVESPSKAKTIKKFLGQGYDVIASKGHVRDLPKSKLGVDIENNFEPHYINMKGKGPVIKELKAHAKKCDRVFLATDPDREGEAISWHIAKILNLDPDEKQRVEFTEITKTGIKNGMANPHKINLDLVNAQQARRILDRIVGYKLSPILWKKVRRGLSAGRVQSVCVKLIVDREREIENFNPEEYWSVDAIFEKSGTNEKFPSKLIKIASKKAELKTKEDADKILESLKGKKFSVLDVRKKVTARQPSPPFTTSTMQQEASGKLGFQARKTMMIAQELYEGLEVNQMGAVGLITYMRTDSLRVSDEARAAAAQYIKNNFGEKYIPAKPKIYKSGKNAQDAHEAIRPSMPGLAPDAIKGSLTLDQYKLYKLIWSRFIASQMADAKLDTMSVDVGAGDCIFRSSGYKIVFKGYMDVYSSYKDTNINKSTLLPDLANGDEINPVSLKGNQHFTQPPARYTESSLIKTLEENGIGRPSTYAPIITTITSRGYVERNQKQLRPTELGFTTTELMEENFKDIVDTKFTANMETGLDEIENGRENWVEYLQKFWDVFGKNLETAEENLDGKSYKIPDEMTDIICEKCGRPMVIKTGRYGKFLACSGFPECKNSKPLVKDTGAKCPICGKRIIQKKSKRGRSFFGCEGYPDCTFATWNEPTDKTCPKCGNTLFKKGIRKVIYLCEKPGCGYETENPDDKK